LPCAPIIRCPDDVEHIIAIANSTAFGLRRVCAQRLDTITRLSMPSTSAASTCGSSGILTELTLSAASDSGLGHKEGVLEAMKSFTNIKTYSLPW
jgi:aldehyde dehydrogenase (NAD+)